MSSEVVEICGFESTPSSYNNMFFLERLTDTVYCIGYLFVLNFFKRNFFGSCPNKLVRIVGSPKTFFDSFHTVHSPCVGTSQADHAKPLRAVPAGAVPVVAGDMASMRQSYQNMQYSDAAVETIKWVNALTSYHRRALATLHGANRLTQRSTLAAMATVPAACS